MDQNLDIAFVYVISTMIGGKPASPVKIGLSSSVGKRLGSIRTASPREVSLLIAFGPFTRATARLIERESHKMHGAFRLNGEWFDHNPSWVIWNVATVASVLCLPPITAPVERATIASRLGIAAAEMHSMCRLED